MPHWRQEAKENARQIRQMKAMREALEWIASVTTNVSRGYTLADINERANTALERVKANSTEPVE